jgi:membrane protease YdiL (CAAX protease family)
LIPIFLVAEPISASHRRGGAFASLSPAAFDRVVNMIAGPFLSAAVIGGVLLTARFVDRRPLADLGLSWGRRSLVDFLFGFALGGVLMTFVFLAEQGAGWVRTGSILASDVPGVTVRLAFLFTIVKALCVGLTEESVSRGYLVPNLTEGVGFLRWTRGRAMLLTAAASSLFFAGIHMGNPNSTALSFAGLWLNGMMLASGFILTGSLALPIALHMAWNLFQGSVYGFPVSGDREAASLIRAVDHGPALMTGGAFGPEAGLVGCLAVLLGIVCIGTYARLRNGSLRPVLETRWLRRIAARWG